MKEFATLVLSKVRVEDFSVRWGGDEFIILLPDTTGEAAYVLAERIRAAFEQNASWVLPLVVTASFGVAQLQEGEQGDALICRADEALYRVKRDGGNRVVAAGLSKYPDPEKDN